MREANLSALFAAEPSALDGTNLGQIFPYLVGVVLVLGIVLVGLVLFRSNSRRAHLTADRPLEEQLDRLYTGPSQLWKLVVPAIAVLVIVGANLYFVIPILKSVADARANLHEQMKANQEAAKKKARHDSFVYYPRGTPPAPKPTPPPRQPLIPGFGPPPPPNTPPITIDSRGVVRIR